MKDAALEVEIFTEAEKEIVRTEFRYERRRHDGDSQTLFTEQNIDSTQNDLTKNVTTKSVILAPFNSTKSHISDLHSSVEDALQDRKDKLRFAAKVRDIDRQYEKNNNCELDNGVYNKLACASSRSQDADDDSNSLSSSFRHNRDLDPHNSSAAGVSEVSDEEGPNRPRRLDPPARPPPTTSASSHAHTSSSPTPTPPPLPVETISISTAPFLSSNRLRHRPTG
jgi:hypothetical protein